MKICLLATAVALCTASLGAHAALATPKPATAETESANQQVQKALHFADRQDYDDAKRGFVATIPDFVVKGTAPGHPDIWNLPAYDFLKSDKVPAEVNPSLWRIGQLNLNNGLFKVTDRVYQVRGFDLSNMTIIEGDSGLILIDPLTATELSAKGLELYYQHRPKKPVVAVIYTHSHLDHYGGAKGVISQEDVDAGKVKVLAPDGFLEEAVSENVYAGNAMLRRSNYQYGGYLPKGISGQIDAGLGKTVSLGSTSLVPPTDIIKKSGETRTIDGVQMEFQMAPNTEAPAEMLVWFPQFKVLDAAEDATHTLHNLYTLRGAQVRDSEAWWKTLNEAIHNYGDQVEVVLAQHHWPTWGKERAVEFMSSQRDMFKYLHDQTLNLANKGFTMVEIAEQLQLPDSIGKQWYNRGYYGSVSHDSKAIYQRYLGWYDSNPAHLYNLPPVEAAKHYVEFMGGADAAISKARSSYEKGEYRWVAEVMDRVVFADPNNKEARDLEADALEQLGYQAENPTWRNEFLMGAFELRNGVPKLGAASIVSPDTIKAMPAEMLLDYMGIRLDGPKAAKQAPLTLNWDLGNGTKYLLEVKNGVLIYSQDRQADKPDATLHASKDAFAALMMSGKAQIAGAKDVKVDGSVDKVQGLFDLLDEFPMNFNIVTP